MARWAAFLGLTAVVLTLLLALARLSSTAVREPTPALPASDDADPGAEPGPDPDLDPAPLGEGPGVPGEGTEQPGAPEGPGAPSSAMGTGALLANVALTQGLFGFLVAGGAWYFGIPAGALGLDPPVSAGALAVGVGFGLVLWVGNELAASVADAVGAAYDERLRGMLAPDSAAGWALLLGVVLPVVAVVEEFIFRAALIGAPAAGFGVSAWALAVVSSAAFALGHGAQGRVGIAVTGGLGLVLAVGYVLTGSLAVVVVAHYLVNALEFLVHELFGWPRLL